MKRVDQCMICDPDPCECGVKKAPVARRKASPPVIEEPAPVLPTAAPRVDLKAKMKAAAAQAPPTPKVRVIHKAHIAEKSDEELLWTSALLSVSTVLHYDEKEKYSGILNTSLTPAERARVWRARKVWTSSH